MSWSRGYKLKGGKRRKLQIDGQWVAYQREMLESPAYRALGLQARRLLNRIEIEHCSHGGRDNGKLPVTYANFVKYGCRRNGVRPALVECLALGFLELVERGRRPYGDIPGKASTYRLTYLPAHDGPATNEWKKIETIAEAKARVKLAMADHEQYLNEAPGSPRARKKRSLKLAKVA